MGQAIYHFWQILWKLSFIALINDDFKYFSNFIFRICHDSTLLKILCRVSAYSECQFVCCWLLLLFLLFLSFFSRYERVFRLPRNLYVHNRHWGLLIVQKVLDDNVVVFFAEVFGRKLLLLEWRLKEDYLRLICPFMDFLVRKAEILEPLHVASCKEKLSSNLLALLFKLLRFIFFLYIFLLLFIFLILLTIPPGFILAFSPRHFYPSIVIKLINILGIFFRCTRIIWSRLILNDAKAFFCIAFNLFCVFYKLLISQTVPILTMVLNHTVKLRMNRRMNTTQLLDMRLFHLLTKVVGEVCRRVFVQQCLNNPIGWVLYWIQVVSSLKCDYSRLFQL